MCERCGYQYIHCPACGRKTEEVDGQGDELFVKTLVYCKHCDHRFIVMAGDTIDMRKNL